MRDAIHHQRKVLRSGTGCAHERSGRFINATLAEYHVPVHLDVPRIEVIWNDIPDPHSPLGLRGIGEIGDEARAR